MLRFFIALLAWTFIGVFFALPNLGGEAGWQGPLLRSLAQWWSWGLMTPLIVFCDARLPFSEKQLARRLLAHLPLSFVLTALFVYVSAGMRALFGFGPWEALATIGTLQRALSGMFLWSWLVYWLILGAWLARQYHQRYLAGELRVERLERLSAEARLHALRMQLDPHFLFNALNTISAQTEVNPKLARLMIEHLGDLLRSTLATKDRQQVPLAEELDLLGHYLAIQRIRFGDRLRFDSSIDPQLRGALVPALLLQPLVENAIRHGISPRAGGGRIAIDARRRADRMIILVQDDGVGLPTNWDDGDAGVGLSVTRQRVLGLYTPGESRFEIRPRPDGGTEAEIELPLRGIGA